MRPCAVSLAALKCLKLKAHYFSTPFPRHSPLLSVIYTHITGLAREADASLTISLLYTSYSLLRAGYKHSLSASHLGYSVWLEIGHNVWLEIRHNVRLDSDKLRRRGRGEGGRVLHVARGVKINNYVSVFTLNVVINYLVCSALINNTVLQLARFLFTNNYNTKSEF
jgi:hypothetical protein